MLFNCPLTTLINGFCTDLTHLSRNLYFLRAFASWLHQSLIGFPRIGTSNADNIIFYIDFHQYSHQIPFLPDHSVPFKSHGTNTHKTATFMLNSVLTSAPYRSVWSMSFLQNIIFVVRKRCRSRHGLVHSVLAY